MYNNYVLSFKVHVYLHCIGSGVKAYVPCCTIFKRFVYLKNKQRTHYRHAVYNDVRHFYFSEHKSSVEEVYGY